MGNNYGGYLEFLKAKYATNSFHFEGRGQILYVYILKLRFQRELTMKIDIGEHLRQICAGMQVCIGKF